MQGSRDRSRVYSGLRSAHIAPGGAAKVGADRRSGGGAGTAALAAHLRCKDIRTAVTSVSLYPISPALPGIFVSKIRISGADSAAVMECPG